MSGRDLADVLPGIIKLVPIEEVELLNILNKLFDNLAYKAPELRTTRDCWGEFITILLVHIPKLEKEWHIKINNIITDA
jgi:hypothetical protein